MEAIAAATAVHSISMGMGMGIAQAFFPAATSTASFVAMTRLGRDRREMAWNLTVASLLFSVVLGLAVGPREWLYESIGAFYLFVIVISTFSAYHNAGEATSGCMYGILIATAASTNSGLALGFRWLAAVAAIGTSLSCTIRIMRGRVKSDAKSLLPSGGPFDIELAVARVLLFPLMLTVVYSQSTERHSLNAGEVLAAILVVLSVILPQWEHE